MRKIFFFALLVFAALQSCRYSPYLKYYHTSAKTHLPHFNKWEKYVGSNTNALRSSYNVTCYDWYVSVDPEKQKIKSVMKIYFRMDSAQKKIMLDFERHMKIDSVKSTVPLKKWTRKKDIVYFTFSKELQKNDKVLLEIFYHGKPINVLSYSTVYWRKDKNNKPLVCTSTEGVGPQHLIPCKMLLGDEPDSCFIRVGVPKGLSGIANGKFLGIRDTPDETIFNWAVMNPINIYNISFNVGDYVELEKDYTDINKQKRKIEIYVLSYNKAKADTFYDQVPLLMRNYENLFGVFPWWNDGCKFIESNLHNNAMEHQSGISMGEGYYYDHKKMSVTLAHELGHEWWGNNITGYDYADIWLHEGFATFCEFVSAEGLYGADDYNNFVRYYATTVQNKRPVLKKYEVNYNAMIHSQDQDIYAKGAMLLHTLRRQLNNDALFFGILKKAQKVFAKSNIRTAQFIQLFNQASGRDFSPYFDIYLNQVQPPILEYSFIPMDSLHSTMTYKWKNNLREDFSMKVALDYKDTCYVLYPSNTNQKVVVPAKKTMDFNRSKFGYILVEVVKN
ncbi:hypothetical protein CNR22_22405 [Sphingobacteriaceae bacterium]|nr:hypothetical protein CNR22_22405 [Sphingobacteriaceae bacterium]